MAIGETHTFTRPEISLFSSKLRGYQTQIVCETAERLAICSISKIITSLPPFLEMAGGCILSAGYRERKRRRLKEKASWMGELAADRKMRWK